MQVCIHVIYMNQSIYFVNDDVIEDKNQFVVAIEESNSEDVMVNFDEKCEKEKAFKSCSI